MTVGKEESERRMKRFAEVCRREGMKITHQRLVIFRVLAATDEHPDVETIYQAVREQMPTISLDTVYRTLWTFRDLGLIGALGPSRERVRFDANTAPHHHFVCTKCGAALDFYSPEFDNLRVPDEVRAFGKALTTQVEIQGICLRCSETTDAGKTQGRTKEEL